MNIQRLKERIENLITKQDESCEWNWMWDKGYNSACEQILEIIKEMEKGV